MKATTAAGFQPAAFQGVAHFLSLESGILSPNKRRLGGNAMSQLGLTKHAQARMQQRGVPKILVEHLHQFGRAVHDHRGARVLVFDHAARRRIRRALGRDGYLRLEKHMNAYAVVSLDGRVITVGHRQRRLRHH